MWIRSAIRFGVVMLGLHASLLCADDWSFHVRFQQEVAGGSGRFHRLTREEKWRPEETAIIVCDVWDLHHCLNAVHRLNQFTPRLNEVLKHARGRGAIIIHSPSDCMPAYKDHSARTRALEAPLADNLPTDMGLWCSAIPEEERAVYPIDQSDGGEDDDPAEHARWAVKLSALGRNPGTPWKTQSKQIEIDAERDYISDRGDEVWNILEHRGIKNVILTGVHVNMCVLGRPFGLRQMARNGKNVVLMRDMTDTMYNPKRWPFVSHYTGNDLIIAHIERHVAPTITSDQILGGAPFVFHDDHRPHLVIVCAEDEYKTAETLPPLALKYLGRDFHVSYVWGSETERNLLPGIEVLDEADAMLVSVRRRTLPTEAMAVVKRFVAKGKPVIGIRTASHAFSLRNNRAGAGQDNWPEFDSNVFGGNYTNHYGNKLVASAYRAMLVPHPIVNGMGKRPFRTGGSLYKTSPLEKGTTTLLLGSVDGQPAEPAAWTYLRDNGGRSFYTSLGHVDDFKNEQFIRLLVQGIYWANGIPVNEQVFQKSDSYWATTNVPDGPHSETAWYRCVLRLSGPWASDFSVDVPSSASVWLNGVSLTKDSDAAADALLVDDANLLVIRTESGLTVAPTIRSKSRTKILEGTWQFRIGDREEWSNMPLPAKFGAGSDIVFSD
ncbi:MAG TPA: isochorismatase family protein [Planctomycetes bacterium]|nr:isochorismatase family protein [Planctomycetota bacterium]